MKYYLIGIKGSGMSTLAQILYDLGYEVSGYDDNTDYKFTEEGLAKRHISIYHDGQNHLSPDTIVTYSAAFKETHPEIQRAKALGLKIKNILIKQSLLYLNLTLILELKIFIMILQPN